MRVITELLSRINSKFTSRREREKHLLDRHVGYYCIPNVRGCCCGYWNEILFKCSIEFIVAYCLYIRNGRMKGILKQITNYISKSVHYTDFRFAPLQRQTTLLHFNVRIPGGTANTQTIFELCPRVLRVTVGTASLMRALSCCRSSLVTW